MPLILTFKFHKSKKDFEHFWASSGEGLIYNDEDSDALWRRRKPNRSLTSDLNGDIWTFKKQTIEIYIGLQQYRTT